MIIHKHMDGKDLVLSLDGSLDEMTSPKLEKEVNDVLDGDPRNILLDLGKVRYISSIGIRVLLMAHKKAVKSGKKVSIENLSGKAREILDVVGILPLFAL